MYFKGTKMWLLLSLLATVSGIVYKWLTWNLDYWQQRGVPGPKGYVLAGSYPKSFVQKINMVYDFEVDYRFALFYQAVFFLYFTFSILENTVIKRRISDFSCVEHHRL